jgi:hypothetical protein
VDAKRPPVGAVGRCPACRRAGAKLPDSPHRAAMAYSKLEYIYKIRITQDDIASLPEDQAACLGVLSFAASESNVLRRTYLHASHDNQNDTTLDSGLFVQRFTLLRIMSAKLFEIEEFLRFEGKNNRTADQTVLSLAEAALSDFEKLKDSDGYRVARKMRHEATNHYSFKAAKRNLKHLPKDANCSLFLHEKNGNSYYPFGEELMFMAGVSAFVGGGKTTEDKLELFRTWFDWTKDAGAWLDRVNYDFHRKIVLSRFPDKVARQEVKWLSPQLAASHEAAKIPLFLRSEDQEQE